MRLPPELLTLAEQQNGLLHYEQLAAHGVTRSHLRTRLAQDWRLVLPRVVALTTARLDARQRLVAAQLYAGPGAMITSAAAARWHGIGAAEPSVVAIEVPHSRRPRGGGFVEVRRTIVPDRHPWYRPPLVIVSRRRAVASAARDCRSDRAACALVLEAVQRQLVRPEDLRHELEMGPRAGSGMLRRAVEAAERGAWSAPEAELGELLDGSPRLPPAWLNPTLYAADGTRLPRPDAWFDDVALAVQVHSRQYHGAPEDWEGTVMTDGLLVECGIVVIAVTPRALREMPARVRARVERTHEQALRRARPPVVAVPLAPAA